MTNQNKILVSIMVVYLIALSIWAFFPPAASVSSPQGVNHHDYIPIPMNNG